MGIPQHFSKSYSTGLFMKSKLALLTEYTRAPGNAAIGFLELDEMPCVALHVWAYKQTRFLKKWDHCFVLCRVSNLTSKSSRQIQSREQSRYSHLPCMQAYMYMTLQFVNLVQACFLLQEKGYVFLMVNILTYLWIVSVLRTCSLLVQLYRYLAIYHYKTIILSCLLMHIMVPSGSLNLNFSRQFI